MSVDFSHAFTKYNNAIDLPRNKKKLMPKNYIDCCEMCEKPYLWKSSV